MQSTDVLRIKGVEVCQKNNKNWESRFEEESRRCMSLQA